MSLEFWKSIDKLLQNKKSFSLLVAGAALFLCLSCNDGNVKNIKQKDDSEKSKISLVEKQDYDEYYKKLSTINSLVETGNYEEAVKMLLEMSWGLLSQEETLEKKDILHSIYSGLWFCYRKMWNFDLSLKYYNNALELWFILDNKDKQIANLNDISLLYRDIWNGNKFFEYLQKWYEIIKNLDFLINNDEIESVFSIYSIQINLANYYIDNKDFISARKYYLEAKEIVETNLSLVKDTVYIDIRKNAKVVVMSVEADFLIAEKKYNQAIELYKEALVLAEETKNLWYQEWLLSAIEWLYKDQFWDYQKAYKYSKITSDIRGQRITSDQQKAIANAQVEYETKEIKLENEKKEAELIAKEFQLEVQKNKNRLAWWLSTAALLMALVGAWFSYALKKKNRIITAEKAEKEQYAEEVAAINDEVMEKNEALQQANQEIKEKKAIVDQYAKDISDSIRYSVKIQGLILAQNNNIQKHFPQSWVFYKPQHIVGWDFYFANETINWKKMLLAGDCTGHGVPGWFLTIFWKIRIEQLLSCAEKPSDIITGLDTIFKDQFTSDPHNFIVDHDKWWIELRDSMEISCVFFDPETKTIEYSLTSVPIIVCRKWEIIKLNTEIRASIWSEKKNPRFTGFQTYEFQLQEGDSVYLFSDGLPDQFLWKTNKKIGSRYFYEILKQISALPVSERSMHIANIYNELMKTEEWKITRQIDDMCLVWFKV